LRLTADKYTGRLLYFCLALGKFKISLLHIRSKKSLMKLCAVVKHSRVWIRKRRANMRTLIVDRIERYLSQNMLAQLMGTWHIQVTPSQLRRLQQFLRFKLFQRRFKYMAMLNAWNALEKISVRARKPRKVDKSRLSEASSSVPERIKAFYIRSKIRQNFIEHAALKAAHTKQVAMLKAKFERNRYKLEAEQLLMGGSSQIELELPEAPVLYYTLGDSVIQELIEKAQGQRIVWSMILEGGIKNFTDLARVVSRL
jgi:hypothetical protein